MYVLVLEFSRRTSNTVLHRLLALFHHCCIEHPRLHYSVLTSSLDPGRCFPG